MTKLEIVDKLKSLINSRTKIMKKFLEKIEKTSKCWIWKGHKNRKGYGLITYNKNTIKVSHLSYKLFKGNIPENMFVCHKCDNPSCVNPNHLFLGTQYDNIQDAINKGRLPTKLICKCTRRWWDKNITKEVKLW